MDIVAVKHGNTGKITNYKLDNGEVIDCNQAVQLVESGKLQGYNISTAKDGTKAIRSDRDDSERNNLSNLPTF